MKLNIIAVGKLRPDLSKIFNTYKQKLNFYVKINVIEIKEHNHKNPQIQKARETKAIIDKIPSQSEIFLCTIHGNTYSSTAFTKLIDKSNVTFVIGGSYGVIEKEFKNKISFSEMTFPHQLFRILLIEQIYRKFAIDNNLKYHK